VVLTGRFATCGGAILREVRVSDGRLDKSGFPYHSGEATLRQKAMVGEEYLDKKVFLEFSEAWGTVEVWVNGKYAGKRLWHPFRVDVANLLVPGETRWRLR